MTDVDRDAIDVLLDPSLDDGVYLALCDVVRRSVLSVLLDREAASLEDLADAAAVRSAVAAADEPYRVDRDSVRTVLHHRHLAALEEAELIVRDDGVVRIGALPEPVRALLEWTLGAESDAGR